MKASFLLHSKFFYLPMILITIIILGKPLVSEGYNQATQDKVKKIIMMLNIAAKEFEEGVVDGKVVIAPEYEESQIFLQQASERFSRISSEIKESKDSKALKEQFSALMNFIKNKVDSQKIWDEVNQINSKLMSTFGIEINKVPVTPVSLTNGKKIFENNCSVCHGMAGHGDGPMAKQFDPAPAVLSNPKLTGDETSTAYDNFEVINVGIANTGMMAWAGVLTESQILDVTYYLRNFSNANVQLPPVNLE